MFPLAIHAATGHRAFSRQGVWHLISLKSGTHKNKAISHDVSAHHINCGAENNIPVRVCLLCIHKAVAVLVLDPPANSAAAWAVCVYVNTRQIA